MGELFFVFTIESCEGGDNFIVEKLFSSYVEGVKRKIELEFKYNTEEYPSKDSKGFHDEFRALHAYLCGKGGAVTPAEFAECSKGYVKARDAFLEREDDKEAVDLPYYISNVKGMTVDSDEDREEYFHN